METQGCIKSLVCQIYNRHFLDRRKITWVGKLVELDAATGIAKVAYRVEGEKHELLVHYSRLYSVTFDSDDVTPHQFPPTRQDLTTKIGNLDKSQENMILDNDGFLADEVPAEVKVRPDRNSPQYRLRGGIESLDGGKSGISALTDDRSFMSFSIPGSYLVNWVRG